MRITGRFMMVLVAAALALPAGATGEDNLFHVVMLRAGDAHVRISLNDVPLIDKNEALEVTSSTQVNGWLKPGENTLTIAITPATARLRRGQARGARRCEVAVVAGRAGDFPEDCPPLLEFKWDPGTESLPLTRTITFQVPVAPPTELWTRAAAATLDAGARRDLAALVRSYYTATVRNDTAALLNLVEFKRVEARLALYETPPTRAELLAALAQEVKQTRGTNWTALSTRNLEFHVVGNGQIVWITGRNRAPAMQGTFRNWKVKIEIYAALIDGRWMLVR